MASNYPYPYPYPYRYPSPQTSQECKYQNSEYRLSVFGVEREEWDRLAAWVVDHQLYSQNNRWIVQVPRLYGLYLALTLTFHPHPHPHRSPLTFHPNPDQGGRGRDPAAL